MRVVNTHTRAGFNPILMLMPLVWKELMLLSHPQMHKRVKEADQGWEVQSRQTVEDKGLQGGESVTHHGPRK